MPPRLSALLRLLQRTSSSSGGESSCEDGAPWNSPALRPLFPHPHATSKHSADTLIYVGPDQSRSNGETPPPSVPIIPSLNGKWLKEEHGGGSGNHFKCNTFAELQEKLDCVDGGEGPGVTQTEVPRTAEQPLHVPGMEPPTDPLAAGLLEAFSSRAEKLLAPRPAAAAAVVDQSVLLGGSSPAGPLRTTVTIQRPVQLTGEDELVFTLVAELPSSRMSDLPGSSTGHSLPTVTSGWQPVSIISSINDEYESFMSLPGCQKPGTSPTRANRPRSRDHPGPIKSLKRAPRPAGPPKTATQTLTASPHQHLLHKRGGSDPSRGGASVSAWKPSSGQVTFRRPVEGHNCSTTQLLTLQGPSSGEGYEQEHSLIQPAATPGAFMNPEEPSGTRRSSTLRKKPNLLKDLRISKKLSVAQKSRTALPPNASKRSQDVPRTATKEGELQHRSSRGHAFTGQRSFTSRSPQKVQSAKQQSSRSHSLNSVEETSGGQTGKSHLTSTFTSATSSNSQDPPGGLRSSSRGDRNSHTGRGTFLDTRLTIRKRLLQLATINRGKQLGGRSHHTRTRSNAGGEAPPCPLPPPSPYSKVTAPWRRRSTSNILSGWLPSDMVHTALLHHRGGASSSGYSSSSAVHDSETTHDSSSERELPSSNQSRAFRLPRKRADGECRGEGDRK